MLTLLLMSGPASARQEPRDLSPGDLYERAIALEREGSHDAALALLWEAAGAAPHDADVQYRLGEALERLGALEAAVDAYHRALTARPGFPRAHRSLVLALVKSGRGPEAVDRARTVADASPGDADALFTLGLALSEQDVGRAIETFRRVLARAPGHTLARYNLALALKRADRIPEAIAELERALAVEPRPEPLYTLGVIYWQQGELDRAVRALRQAIAEEPGYADAHYTLGAVLSDRGQWREAAAALRRAIELRPDLPGIHYTLARALRRSGDSESAVRHLAEAERLRRSAAAEQEARVWTSVGVQKFEADDFIGAVDAFRRATTVRPDYAPAHYQLGRALERLGEPDAARSAFARAHQLNPNLVPPERP